VFVLALGRINGWLLLKHKHQLAAQTQVMDLSLWGDQSGFR
jgi:hypothetical protein